MLTVDEIDDELTTLYHMQRINFETADELGQRARPLWQSLPETQRLCDVATKPKDHRYLYDEQRKMGGTSFNKTVKLAPLLEPGNWPDFLALPDDTVRHDHIKTWTELIGLSEEAKSIQNLIDPTGNRLTQLCNIRPLNPRPAQDLRGWYVRIGTSRRSTIGWVVGGRGNSIQILPDRFAMVERFFTAPSKHRAPVTDSFTARTLAPHVMGSSTPEVEKYSMKTAHVELRLPPEMAAERKEWAARLFDLGCTVRDDAKAAFTEYAKWEVLVTPIRGRDAAIEKWNKGLPTSLHENWVVQDQMRWIVGGTEAIEILFDLMPEADLREAIIARYRAKHADLFVTDAERALLDNPPALGAEDFGATFVNVMKAKYTGGFAPMF